MTLCLTIMALGLLALLAGCGDNAPTPAADANPNAAAPTSTPIPTFTPAPTSSNSGGPQVMQFKPKSGTVESYDAASKLLTIKGSDGKDQKFSLGNAKIVKSEQVTADAFSKLLTADSNVAVVGDKASDGTYTARALTLLGENAITIGGPPGGGNGSGQAGDQLKAGTPQVIVGTAGSSSSLPAGTPGPGGNFQVGGQVTPGETSGSLPLVVRSPKLENNQLSGSNPLNNEPITVKLTGDTKLTRQTAGKPEDLKAGQTVNVTAQTAQGDAPSEALFVSIE